MASYYVHNYGAFGQQVLCAGFMLAAMHARAVAVQAAAQSIAPVYTGEYLDSFDTSSGTTFASGGRRAYGRVTNSSGHAIDVEYGFGNVPRYRVLGKSLGAAGGDVHAQ